MDVRLSGQFRLRSPLSHQAESISTTTYLVQEPVLQPDGTVEEVFCYSGNAWRGQLRDLAATYLLAALGDPTVSLDAFHLLYAGGRIGGEQAVNLEQARRYRREFPLIALWGGGIGNQILPGKLRVSNCYPICREAPRGGVDHPFRATVSYRSLTCEKSFSRKDDSKDERLNVTLGLPAGQAALPGLAEEPAKAKRGRSDGEVAEQMRMTSELVIAGTLLETAIEVLDVSEVELGCLVSALNLFARSPHIGGQIGRGHGLVDLGYGLTDLTTGVIEPAFVTIAGGVPSLSPPAADAKAAYDAHLRQQYDAYIADHTGEFVRMLGAKVA